MSQESANIKLLKRFVEAYNEREVESLLGASQPDFEYHGLAHQPDSPKGFAGRMSSCVAGIFATAPSPSFGWRRKSSSRPETVSLSSSK